MLATLTSRQRNRLFALLIGLTVLVFWGPLWTLVQFSRQSEQYSHLVLIPIVAVVLLYQERAKIFSRVESGFAWGGPVAAAGALFYALHLFAGSRLSENDRVALAIFSVVLIWLGLFLMFYGRQAFRAGLFPLLFLFLMVPIPQALLGSTIRVLQLASAEATDILFQIFRVPVYRDGMVFALTNNIVIEVARECSGIRSSLALFITSLLAGHLFLRSRWTKVALYVAVFPITVFKNGLRIVGLSVYAAYVNPAILDGLAHRRGGIPFFGLALLVLGVVLWMLRKTERGSWMKWRERNSNARVPQAVPDEDFGNTSSKR